MKMNPGITAFIAVLTLTTAGIIALATPTLAKSTNDWQSYTTIDAAAYPVSNDKKFEGGFTVHQGHSLLSPTELEAERAHIGLPKTPEDSMAYTAHVSIPFD